jgi:hypothetical protein
VAAATVPTERTVPTKIIPLFEVFFQLSLICVFPFFAMVYIDLDFNFTMISHGFRIVPAYIFQKI